MVCAGRRFLGATTAEARESDSAYLAGSHPRLPRAAESPDGSERPAAVPRTSDRRHLTDRASLAEMGNKEKMEIRHWSREAHTRYRKSWLATPPQSGSPPTSCAVLATRPESSSGGKMQRRPGSARRHRW